MQSRRGVYYAAATYPEGRLSGDVCRQNFDDITSHLYERRRQYDIQPTMNGSDGGVGHRDDLSNLSDAERGLVLEVLRRDEELREQELTRIEVLKSEVEALQHQLAANESAGDGRVRGRRCSLCSASFGWIFSRGDTCRRCQKTRVCGNCRHTTKTIERWICLLCHKKEQLYLKSGSWFHRTFSGRRRLRRLTESESSLLTFRHGAEGTSRPTVTIDDVALATSRSFSSATLPRTMKPQAPPSIPKASAIGSTDDGGHGGHVSTAGQTDTIAYPDENDKELLLLLSKNLNKKDLQAPKTDVELIRSQPQDRPVDAEAVARRRADAEVFRRGGGHLAVKRCLSDEFPEWLRNHEIRGLRSYRTVEDLSSSGFRDDRSDSTNSSCTGKEASDSELEPVDESIWRADNISKQVSLQNETGDFINKTSSFGEEDTGCSLRRNYPGTTGISDESITSKDFQTRESQSPGSERKRSSGTEQKRQVTEQMSHVTNLSDSRYLSSPSPEIMRPEVTYQSTDEWRSYADDSLIPEDLDSKTLEMDLDFLTWKAEIENLFEVPSLMYEQDWDGEIDSLGVLREVDALSGSGDGGKGAGADQLLSHYYFSPLEDASVDRSQPILVEVSEEERRLSLLSQQLPKRYLRIFNDEDSLSMISERTEPTPGCSDQASVDFDLPASETGWQSDDDDESLEVTLTDLPSCIDRVIDRIVSVEMEVCPPLPRDLDAEIDRLVAANREHLSETPEEEEATTLSRIQVDEMNESCSSHQSQCAGSLFGSDKEHYDNGNNTQVNCGSMQDTCFSWSPDDDGLPSGNNFHMTVSNWNPTYNPLPLRPSDDLGDASTSDPVRYNCLSVVDKNSLLQSLQVIQPLTDNSAYSTRNVGEKEYRILDLLENGTGRTQTVGNCTENGNRLEVNRSHGELFLDEIDPLDVDKLDSSVDDGTKETENKASGDSFREDRPNHSPTDWKNLKCDVNGNDGDRALSNQRTPVHGSENQ